MVQKNHSIPKLDSSIFDWLLWRNGTPLDIFGIACRTADFVSKRELLRKHAIGWCPAERLVCRPKLKNMAVMFDVNGHVFWFHMREHEFAAVFEKLTKFGIVPK